MPFAYSHDIKIFSFSETCLWCEGLLCVGGRDKHLRGTNTWSNIGLRCYQQEARLEITFLNFGDYEMDLLSLPFIDLITESICRGEIHRRVFTYCKVYCPTGPGGEVYLLYEKLGGKEERQLGSWWVLSLVKSWTVTKHRHKQHRCPLLLASFWLMFS